MNEFEVVGEWLERLRQHLDLEGLESPDLQDLLDTVRLTARGVIHAAGPVSAFAVGYAAAKADGSAETVARLFAQVRAALPPGQAG